MSLSMGPAMYDTLKQASKCCGWLEPTLLLSSVMRHLQVEVLRGGRFMSLPSTVLVPGDVIAVVTGVLPADCVLLSGECIVDENMLTGETTHGT